METTLHLPGHSALSLAVISLLAGLNIALWRVRLGRWRRVVMGLHIVALSGVLLAYFQPAIRIEEVVRSRSPILVVADESASMLTRGPDGRRRSEYVADFFVRHSDWADDLERRHDVRWFACSDHARPVDRRALEAPLPARGAATDLDACLDEAIATLPSRVVGGVLLVTDGTDPDVRMAERPERRTTLASGPFWILLASEPGEVFKDIGIAAVGGLDFILARNLVEVRVVLRSEGLGSQRVEVRLRLDKEVADSKEVVLPAQDGTVEVPLFFLPRGPGRHLLEIETSVLEGEASEANNRFTTAITVVRDRTRILHVAGHPSWDQRFLREALRQRRGVELISFHTLRDPEVASHPGDDDATLLIPFPAEEIFVRSVDSFDLIVLQDYELPEADRERYAENLIRYVSEGGGLLFFGGSFSLGAQGPWPDHLAPILPVLPPRAPGRGMLPGRFEALVPNRSRGHPVLAARPGSRPLVDRIRETPPLPAINVLQDVAPGAEVLIEVVGADPGPFPSEMNRRPLVIVSGYGKGVVGLVATDTLWRWAFDTGTNRVYEDLIHGLVDTITKDPSARPLRVRVERDRVAPGQVFKVEVISGSGPGEVLARIERGTGYGGFEPTGIGGTARLDEDGRATLRFVLDEEGAYRVEVTARADGEVRTGSDVFVVGHDLAEMLHLRPTARQAQAMAKRFGGEVHTLSNPALERFSPRMDSTIRTGTRIDLPIWDHPAVLLLILAVLGLEWYLERRLGQG